MPTGPPPSLPERVVWNLTLSFKARETDRAGSRAHSSLDCREVCRLARWVHFTALQQYVSLLPGAVLCRGRGSLKLLAEAGPAVSLLPAASSPGAGRVLTVSRDGQVKRAPKSSIFQCGSLSSILRDSPGFSPRWGVWGWGGGATIGVFLRLRKLLLKKLFFRFLIEGQLLYSVR